MLVGVMTVDVWRASVKRDRDGDAKHEFHHTIDNCIFQERDMSNWAGSEKSDGGRTMYAVEADAELYVNPTEDIQEGDKVRHAGYEWLVTSHLIVGTYPSGWQPGAKVYLQRVGKW